MAVNIDSVSTQLFKIIKGNGYAVQLFTAEGKSSVDPEEARRYYIGDEKIMINLESNDEHNEIKVNLGKSTNLKAIRPMLDSIRNLATRNIIEYTLKTFGKDIEPKDFAFLAKKEGTMEVKEGFSKAYGSTKSSYQTLENARLIIKHRKNVDEEVRGSRSRNIHSLFIENNEGERFKFPNNHLPAARAMTRHVKEGGTPFDMIGEHIIALSEEFAELQKFRNYAKKNSLVSEDTADVIEGVSSRLDNIKKEFKSLSGTKGYTKYVENFENKTVSLEEEGVDSLRDQFTVRKFDETVADALPHVARVVKEIKVKESRETRLKDIINKVINNKDNLELRKELDSNDPDNPENLRFSNNAAKMSAFSGFLSKYVTDDELSNMLAQLSDDIHDYNDKQKSLAIKLLTFIKSNANVKESKNVSVGTEEAVVENIVESFSKFDPEDFLL